MIIPIIGIDPSLTGTGIAVWRPDTGKVDVTTISSTAKDGGSADPQRHRKLAAGVFGSLGGMLDTPWHGPWSGARGLVFMEGLAYANVTGNVLDLAGWRGILAYGLAARGFLLVDHVRQPPKMVKGKKVTPPDPTGKGIAPTSLKLYALGKGGGAGTDKDAMILAAQRRFAPDVVFKNNNEADALWLLDLGVQHYVHDPIDNGNDYGRAVPTPRSREALSTIEWPDLNQAP